ncbi:MAG: ABC transporter permease [Acidobacteriota bacterium]
MSTATIPFPTQSTTSRNLRIFLTETRYEFIRSLRTRAFSLSAIGFPVMFYCLFGLMMNRNATAHGQSFTQYLLASYAVFGVVGAALFGIGVGLAGDLSAGWLELKRASPMPPLAYLLAKCITAMAFGTIILLCLCTLGITLGHVQLTLPEFSRMLAFTLVGCLPFTCMGLALALIVPFNSAPGITNLLYLPMSFLGGLWIPISVLPKAVQHIAPLLPTYHLAQLMLSSFGYQDTTQSAASHWCGLAAFTMIMLGIAWIAFRRREQNS